MDIYPIALLYYLFKPKVIEWPIIDGTVSLKLDNINQANHFTDGQAHHAMVDVEVTLALAKRLYQEQQMWHYLCDYFSKQKDTRRLSKINHGIAVDGKIGSKNNFMAPILSIGGHNVYSNQTLWLRLDDEQLQETAPDEIFVIRKKAG